jgi:phospholipid/cholesterol/gamma-HCH transport system ATP-binding protein
MAVIELKGVWKRLSGWNVLADMNLSVKEGETFVIIGRSGIGKSVTLKHIVGLMRPDQGTVTVDGISVPGLSSRELVEFRVRFGYLFQSNALLNSLSVAENVALPLRERERLPEEEIRGRVSERLRVVELEGTEDLSIDSLSGGMKKRVALARAVIHTPKIILYDEPTTGLDPVTAANINIMIRKTQKEFGVTAVVVTHDMNSAYFVGDKIGLLHGGHLMEVGTPEEIKNSKDRAVHQFINGLSEGPMTDKDYHTAGEPDSGAEGKDL